MYDELVKRLRGHNGWALNETLDKAADVIEKLEQENRFLKAMQKQLVKGIPGRDLGRMVYNER